MSCQIKQPRPHTEFEILANMVNSTLDNSVIIRNYVIDGGQILSCRCDEINQYKICFVGSGTEEIVLNGVLCKHCEMAKIASAVSFSY